MGSIPKKAVALSYRPSSDDEAPIVVAKGQNLIGEKIIQMAKENNITIEQNAELTELLYATEVGQQIPPEAFVAVAEIIRYLYSLR